MSYEGGKLKPWFDRTPNERFCRRAAGAGGRALMINIREKTPVDTGELRRSIRQGALRIKTDARGRRVFESPVSTHLGYAAPIEYGWGLWGPHHARYPIRPKNPDGWLHWVDPVTGKDVFRKIVWHPGAPGAHMFVGGAGVTEKELPMIIRPSLARWKLEVEHQNRSGVRSFLP